MLELKSVSTSYGPVPMLRNVSLAVNKGELVCLLGPNGAGKSTTFNAICGLIRLDAGSIRIAGKDVAAVGTERLSALGVGFVPEGRRLFPTLNVRENLKLAFDASRCRVPFEDRLEAMASLFPRIRERLWQGAGTMSGGEQAMVALARALIGDPQLVVMDEPSLGLSPKLIDEYFDIVGRIRDEGKTVLLIEQNAETALSIADRGYLLVRGQIAAGGTSKDLLANDTVHHLYL
ncbi:ABC transporter ATP-binding protein [Labrys okinawensis]|uniref:ABC transporter ATP-binding protein n=1 Tax=Labrys okinawensis TaxID=346911 RepID=A0A2S9Q8W3_9HYPH|nr:ABC transporter ATP-binding protein [Labrys okinawensis]PRH85796.1 ABC transporter ATP-binding protein [Labrys okinawensis]